MYLSLSRHFAWRTTKKYVVILDVMLLGWKQERLFFLPIMDYKGEWEEKNLKGGCSCCCWSALFPSIILCHTFVQFWTIFLNTFFKYLSRHFLTKLITKYFLEVLEIIFSINMNFWFQQKLLDNNYENWGKILFLLRKGGTRHRKYFLNEAYREKWDILRHMSYNPPFHWAPKISFKYCI